MRKMEKLLLKNEIRMITKNQPNYKNYRHNKISQPEKRKTNKRIAAYGINFVSPIHCFRRFLFDWYKVW